MSTKHHKISKGILFKGVTANPTDPDNGDMIYRSDLSQLLFYQSAQWNQVQLGASSSGGGGIQKISLVDTSLTTLPTGASATIDGVAVVNGDLVLFTALSTGANQVYLVGGVGTSITWTAQTIFTGIATPTSGDLVYVKSGTGYALQVMFFNGTAWLLFDKDFKVFTAGEAMSAGSLTYVSVGNANGDTGNTAGSAYLYSPFNIYKCRPAGFVINAVTAGQQCLVQVSGAYTSPIITVTAADYGRKAWALTATTISTTDASTQRQNSGLTAHSWGLYEASLGTILDSNKIALSIQSNFVPTYVGAALATTNTAANVDATNLTNISNMSDGLYSVVEYSVIMKDSTNTDKVQSGILTAWKGDGINWDYNHSFNIAVDIGFKLSVTAAGVIQCIAPTTTINSITKLKIHSK